MPKILTLIDKKTPAKMIKNEGEIGH